MNIDAGSRSRHARAWASSALALALVSVPIVLSIAAWFEPAAESAPQPLMSSMPSVTASDQV